MKFDTTLRPQDKRTIAIVVYIAIVALFGWYMIRPAAMQFLELDDKIRAAEALKSENKMKTLQLGVAEVLYDKAVTDINDSTKVFYDVMDNSRIEKMGTTYILGLGLTPVDFAVDIRDGSYILEDPYAYSDIRKIQTAKAKVTETDTATPVPTKKAGSVVTVKNKNAITALDVKSLQTFYNQAVNGVTTTEPSEVQCAKITIVVQGPQTRCQRLIDNISKNSSIRITGFEWSDAKEIWVQDEKGNKTLTNPEYKELRLNLNFYMTVKPQFEKKEG